ncbi:MAG TPA: hypothetical protein VLU46_15860, partial [Thermoanaerobaculia bacterium]|nr:hypothetical protein [Thermoanaerobaculia bacterium]
MVSTRGVADFLHDLQKLERASLPADAAKILDAFTRHTMFESGAVYLRDGSAASMRLAAKSQQLVAPEILDGRSRSELQLDLRPAIILPLRSHREDIGLVALSGREVNDDDLALVRA